jgi:hypothetical protein
VRVVVDTNAFYSDLRLRGPLRVLVDATRRGEITLVVPEVVVREVLKRFRERYLDDVRKWNRAVRALAELGVDDLEARRLPDVEDALIEYEAYLRTRLHDAGALVPLIPTVGHDEVLDRAIHRRKPFKESGAGYQDALIWATVLEEAESGDVALVTENTADFGQLEDNEWRLADELLEDVEALEEGSSRVTLYTSLRDFIATALPPQEDDDLTEIRGLLIEDDAARQVLETVIEDDLERGVHWFAGDLLRVAEVEDARIENASVEAIDVVDVYEFEEESELYVRLRARVAADVSFDLSMRDAYELTREERSLISTWGEDLITGIRRVGLDVDAEVVLDSELVPQRLEIVAVELVE